ncbi:Myocyte-specific enhancer factor 2D [Saguinus oedipus]|uniref:Myocyte-specific enhancer factor 2D n=1 Tax=Saguinus oedipus TaxID=9490 RepID=A0ABQ9UMN0_SAGOE|nr:Myocyte-specific enhancer factor 2D [Saguinus oedipus]
MSPPGSSHSLRSSHSLHSSSRRSQSNHSSHSHSSLSSCNSHLSHSPTWSLNLIPGSPLPHVGAALTITTHPHISIKSEQVSPSHERRPAPPHPAVFPAARPEPGNGLSSPAGESYETGDRDDGRGDFGPTLGLLSPAAEPKAEGSAVKRMRLDTWTLK